jgi:hypothetical protein
MGRKRKRKTEASGAKIPRRYLWAIAVVVGMFVLICRRLIY